MLYVFTLLFPFLLLATSIENLNSDKGVRWVITKACSLEVKGSTSVSKFSCVIASYNGPDTVNFLNSHYAKPIKMSGAMILDIKSFDCHNQLMTDELRKTLKSKQFPKLIIRFISIARYPVKGEDRTQIKGLVSIELAGVVKRFELDYFISNNHSGHLVMMGKRNIRFSDFNIKPPSKLGGMIKTNDELLIEFNLNIKVID